jgi:hypothetical protein
MAAFDSSGFSTSVPHRKLKELECGFAKLEMYGSFRTGKTSSRFAICEEVLPNFE